jgi:hypothetical protein
MRYILRGTYKDAQKELTRLLRASDDGTLTDPSRVTVGEYVRRLGHSKPSVTLDVYGHLLKGADAAAADAIDAILGQ